MVRQIGTWLNTFFLPALASQWILRKDHRDKTRVQMSAKNISSFESKMLAVYGPHSWF
jgi:hypothetical protein